MVHQIIFPNVMHIVSITVAGIDCSSLVFCILVYFIFSLYPMSFTDRMQKCIVFSLYIPAFLRYAL